MTASGRNDARPHPGRQIAKAAASTEAEGEGFEEQAARLQEEISDQLARATDAVAPVPPANGKGAKKAASAGASAKRPLALSRMTKPLLIAECEERKLETTGTVAELRVRLRLERKRDTLVAELLDRGWSELQSRRALGAVGWDLDDAIAVLSAPKQKKK